MMDTTHELGLAITAIATSDEAPEVKIRAYTFLLRNADRRGLIALVATLAHIAHTS